MAIPLDRELEQQAEEVLRALSKWRLPVNPFDIVRDEEIELAPGEYNNGFDGRIRYLRKADAFSLAYRVAGLKRTEGRVRFTIAHELGHFYLHRKYLLKGACHGSVADFRSKNPMEQEADGFAAALLMPMELFRNTVSEYRQSVCTLEELCELANRLGTSITSTVRRYCQSDIEPCGAVFSRNGVTQWAWFSEGMSRLHMGFVPFGTQLPRTCRSAALFKASWPSQPVEGEISAETWFERPWYRGNIWEEAMVLGDTGLVLTYLTLLDQV